MATSTPPSSTLPLLDQYSNYVAWGSVHDVIRSSPEMIDLFENLTLGILQEASNANMGWMQLINIQDAFSTVRERMGKEMLLHRFLEGAATTPACFQELRVRGMDLWKPDSFALVQAGQPQMPSPCCCVSNSCSDGLTRQIKAVLRCGAARSNEEEDLHQALIKLFPHANKEKQKWDRALALFVVDTDGTAVCYQNARRKRVLGVLDHCKSCSLKTTGSGILTREGRPTAPTTTTETTTTPKRPTAPTISAWLNATPKKGRPFGCSAACRAWHKRQEEGGVGSPRRSPRPKNCTSACRRRQRDRAAKRKTTWIDDMYDVNACIARGKRLYRNLLEEDHRQQSSSSSASSNPETTSAPPKTPTLTGLQKCDEEYGMPLHPSFHPERSEKDHSVKGSASCRKNLLFEKC